jgi:predicted PurR-regulated permease PerM
MLAASTFYPRVFALVVAAFLGYALFLIFAPFVGALSWAAFLAFLLFPLNVRLRRRLRGPGGAAGLLTFFAPIVILLPLSALSVDFVAQISGLLQKLQKATRQWDIKSFADLQQFPMIVRANDWLQSHAGVSAAELEGWLVTGTQHVLQRAAGFSGSFFLGALDSLFSFAIMLFLLYFFLRDGDVMMARAQSLIPLDDARKVRLFHQLSNVTRAIVFGTSMTALAQGILIGIGFAIADLPSPVVFGVLAALLSMLPVGGAGFVWAPAAVLRRPLGLCDLHAGVGLDAGWSRQCPAAHADFRPGENLRTGGVRRCARRHPGLRRHRRDRRAGGPEPGDRTGRVCGGSPAGQGLGQPWTYLIFSTA